jgi:uncharacterized membrane protein
MSSLTEGTQAGSAPARRARVVFAGAAGVIFLWLLLTPGGVLGKADALGYAVCHRIDLRSFHLGLRPLPLCARCTGMYLGALLGLAFYALRHPRAGRYPARPMLFLFALLALAWALDGLNSFLSVIPGAPHLYTPHNTLRLVTGTGVGLALATLISPAFNQVAWSDWRDVPALASWKELGLLLMLAAVIVALVLSGNPLVLYPLALISAAGVLALLTSAYGLITIPFLRRTAAGRWAELALPLTAALALSLVQIGAIDLIRFAATGTWDGFHL